MTQMDINFCISLFCIFLRNVMAFDKGLIILYGFFNLRISKKTYPSRKKPQLNQKLFFFFFLNFILFNIKMHIILYKIAKLYILNWSRSILLVLPKYSLENQKIWSFYNVYDDAITHSCHLVGSFLVFWKLIMIF